ncbi:MAG: hypothetical protein LUQ47_03870, partial [Methanotrichaceae archaeon]|nr:hypothetical protein [Methanotrichaceae archaeon]
VHKDSGHSRSMILDIEFAPKKKGRIPVIDEMSIILIIREIGEYNFLFPIVNISIYRQSRNP